MNARPDGLLDELAAFLTTPAKSGLYVSRADVVVLAQLSEGSFRISERHRMLADVFRSAQSLSQLSQMLGRLAALAAAQDEALAALEQAYPRGAPSVAPWRQKLARARQRLKDLDEELAR